jgi:hypothetical protein
VSLYRCFGSALNPAPYAFLTLLGIFYIGEAAGCKLLHFPGDG